MITGPLPLGTRFWTTLGPCRLMYKGQRDYFQRDQRRYLCECIQWSDEILENVYRHHEHGRKRRRVYLEIVQH